MLKKLCSLLLCLLLMCSLILPVTAEPDAETEEVPYIPTVTLQISNAESFREFAENCRLDAYSQNLRVILTGDIDLSHLPFEGIPIFCGTFDGGGHTISGLSVTGEGSAQGLFRYLAAGATLQNLNVTGNVLPQGSRDQTGGIVGSNAGTVSNCTFTGTVSASDKVGGIAGVNTVSGIIENCRVEGQIQGDHFIGGIVGENMGVIRSCVNAAPVNITPQQNSVNFSDITLESVTNSEAANTVTDVGGIAGTSGGVIRSCGNLADIGYRQMGYNIGGIAGSQMGYITDCLNRGRISGRKEVGGIVGQMEPITSVIYNTDTLQILQEQLNTMGALAGQASATIQSGGSAITGQVAAMQDHANTAKDAINILLPGSGTPDADQIQAARNALSSSFSGMQKSAQSISSATQNTVAAISRDLKALTGQINAMGQTLSGASENLGGTVSDVSDMDTPEDTTGKVSACSNLGAVSADMNAGGIVGAIAPENDLDHEEDMEISGEQSLNFDSEVRAVVLDCENNADIFVSKRGGGGVVGRMALGLVRNGRNFGAVDGSNADYVGGVVGQSLGFVRACYAKAKVSGKLYTGGIAGSAKILTDCRSVVQLSAREKKGAILGFAEDLENITGNYYFTLEADPGAVDGISYANHAQSLNTEEFLALTDIPARFRVFTVSFTTPDGTTTKTVIPGNDLLESDIPKLPEKEGCTAYWEGLEGLTVSFDMDVQAVYTPYTTVIAVDEARKDGRPVFLAEGLFAPGSALRLEASQTQLQLKLRQKEVDQLTVTLPEDAGTITLRYLPPVDTTPDTLLYLDETGTWQLLPYHLDGSYYVFTAPSNTVTLAAVHTASIRWVWYTAAGILLAAGLATLLLTRKKRKN